MNKQNIIYNEAKGTLFIITDITEKYHSQAKPRLTNKTNIVSIPSSHL